MGRVVTGPPRLYDDPDEDHSWEARARCVGHDTRLWFPTTKDTRYAAGEKSWETPDATSAAKAICEICPVREECLEAALRRGEPVGVWGGMTTKERKAIRRARLALAG